MVLTEAREYGVQLALVPQVLRVLGVEEEAAHADQGTVHPGAFAKVISQVLAKNDKAQRFWQTIISKQTLSYGDFYSCKCSSPL